MYRTRDHQRGIPITGEIPRFLAVGTIGFFTDAAILFWLTRSIGVDPLVARLFSFPPAFLVTWLLNRYWTFTSGKIRPVGQQLLAYVFVQISGAATNYTVYAALLLYVKHIFVTPIIALAVAAVVSAALTFVLSKTVAFSVPIEKQPQS